MSFIGESNFSSDPISSPWAPSALKQEGPVPSCSLLPWDSPLLLQRTLQDPAQTHYLLGSLERYSLAQWKSPTPTRSNSRLVGAQGRCPLVKAFCLGQGKGGAVSLPASSSSLFLCTSTAGTAACGH